MHKLITKGVLLVVLLGSAFTLTQAKANAQETTTTQESEEIYQLLQPGVEPDSPFYFLKRLGEKINMAFTFNAEAKARKSVKYAEKRLAEAKAMADKGKPALAEKVMNDYGEMMSYAANNLAQAAQEGKDIEDSLTNLVEKSTGIHQQVLTDVYEKVPEEAKEGIEKAMEKSSQGQTEAFEALTGEKQEEILEKVKQNQRETDQAKPEVIDREEQEKNDLDKQQSPRQRSLPERQPTGEEIPSQPADIDETETDQKEEETTDENNTPVEIEIPENAGPGR
ncbi:MAG: DUF5667 domain-containing protein [Patescibacteria group bacterium]